MMNKKAFIKISICIISLLITTGSIYKITIQVKEQQIIEANKETAEKQAQKAKKAYDKRRDEVQKEFYAENHTDDSNAVKEVASHNNASVILNDVTKNFFEVYFTWHDSIEYKERENKLSSVASEELLNNKAVFDSGEDTLGGDYVENTGVKAEFLSSTAYLETNVTGLVKVNYKSWFNDEKSSSERATRYYYVKLDDMHKLTTADIVFNSER